LELGLVPLLIWIINEGRNFLAPRLYVI